MTATGVGLDRDGIPNVLQQPKLGYGAPVHYGAPVQYGAPVSYGAATMTVTGVDLNRDGTPNALQQTQMSYADPVQFLAPAVCYAAPAPVQYAALVTYAATPTMTVTGGRPEQGCQP